MPTRTQATRRPAAGRFARPGGGTPAQRPSGRRPAAPTRRPTLTARRKPQKSGAAKAIGTLGSVLPGMAAKKPGRATGGGRKGRTAGLAMLAGAAGLAMKNRGKLMSMFGGKGGADRQEMTAAPGANSDRDAVITPPDTGSPGAAGMPAPADRPADGVAPLDPPDRPTA
jgi:hypothetical protein